MRIKTFHWDQYNELKCQKHGLSVQQIEDFFLTGPSFAEDSRHSVDEDRYIAFGQYMGRYIVCAFTFRVVDFEIKIRVISARFARRKEIEAKYDKTKDKK
jgi:uncharacterized DUF497 family protein